MRLPVERIGGYVRALRAGLDALVPGDEHVPLSAAAAHLYALDPALSGDLLLPAEHSEHTGMPSFTWMERVNSEQALARRGDPSEDPTEVELSRIDSLDPALGHRMRARRDLHRHLRERALLPVLRLQGEVRRRHAQYTDLNLRYDRLAPDGRWLRIRVELRAQGRSRGRLWGLAEDGQLLVDESLQHLFTRHFATPLLSLRGQIEDATGCEVRRLGRGWVGPFWFPGVRLPEEVPASLGEGLLLHLSGEVVAVDIPENRSLDPLAVGRLDPLPDGMRVFRERRFAGSPGVVSPLKSWLDKLRIRTVVVEIGRRGRKL